MTRTVGLSRLLALLAHCNECLLLVLDGCMVDCYCTKAVKTFSENFTHTSRHMLYVFQKGCLPTLKLAPTQANEIC